MAANSETRKNNVITTKTELDRIVTNARFQSLVNDSPMDVDDFHEAIDFVVVQTEFEYVG